MSLSSISIRRPVLAIVMSLVLVIFGIVSYVRLGVRDLPATESPVVSVRARFPGADARVIESQITTPLEEAINAVAGIRSLTSVSREGSSSITVEFDLSVDMETAANDVRDRVSRAVRSLPPDADPPGVYKADADSTTILMMAVRSSQRDLLELTEIAENVLKARLQTIPGVSEIDTWGRKVYVMRLQMDPHRLAAYRLSPVDVRNALNRANVELPSGRIEGDHVELTVRTLGRMSTVEEFNNLIIKRDGDRVVRFSDVGRAELGALEERSLMRRNGIPMVGVTVRPQPGANHIQISDEFYRRVAQLAGEIPEDIELIPAFDVTTTIRAAIREVRDTIFLALCLVIAIIFLFLREWRTAIIPVIVIPIALISSFFVMYLAGFSINVLTLLAIVLAIGLVVDDAIVVVENIYAKIERGMDPITAGILGVKEIFLAVIATTLALTAVFMPILFLGGLAGRLFREFGVVLAGCVVVSSFVALTLTPMLSTRLLKRRKQPRWFYRKTEPFFVGMSEGYRWLLGRFMRVRWLAFPLLAATVGGSWLLVRQLPTELAPMEDRNRITLRATAPEGASYEYMDSFVTRLVALVEEEVPEIDSIVAVTSPTFGSSGSVNSAFVRLMLKNKSERTRTQQEIADGLSRAVRTLTEARVSVSQDPTIGDRRSGMPVQFVIQAQTLEQLQEVIPAFLDEANADPTFSFVDVNLKFNKPELQVHVHRDRAQILGVSVLDISQALQSALSEQRFGYFLMNGRQYQVIGQFDREFRRQTLDLQQIYVPSTSGNPVPLGNLVTIEESSSPPQLFHYNRYSSANISANLAPGKTLGEGIAAMRAIGERVLDDRFSTALSGQSKDFEESSTSLAFVFVFALVLVYLVLAAQFESFRDPFTIMLTVPLALAGAVFALWATDQSLNVFSQIGLIMLIGLVTKNGILLVEFANQRKAQGQPLLEAVQDAAGARFRAILMTTSSTILGIAPIALALGAGAESRVSMGIGVIGGLIVGSVLTLFVIPAVYSYVSSDKAGPPVHVKSETEQPLVPSRHERQPEPVAVGFARKA